MNPKVSTKKKNLLELTNDFSMVVAYKINIWKSIAFLYISNEIPETVKKKKKKSHLKSHKNMPRNKLNQGDERFIC